MEGFHIAWKTTIILPQLKFIQCIQGGDLIFLNLLDFLMNKDQFGYLCNSPINGDLDVLRGFLDRRKLIGGAIVTRLSRSA